MANNAEIDTLYIPFKKLTHLNLFYEEETDIIIKISVMIRIGFPVRSKHVFDLVQNIMIKEKRRNNFVNNRPDEEWLNLLYIKYPKVRQALDEPVKVYLRTYNILEWFDNLRTYITGVHDFKMVKKATRIWVFDLMEFGFIKETGYYTTDTTIKNNVTTLATTFCATGDTGPNMLIYNNTEKFFQKFIKEFPPNWMLKISENAQITVAIFEAYISVFSNFLKEQEIELPILLLVNAQRIPFRLELSDFCKEKGIIIHSSYLNSPNIYRPVQGDCMYCIKQAWYTIINERYKEKTIKKSEFLPLIKEVFETLAPITVRNIFRTNGIYPWRPAVVAPDKGKSGKCTSRKVAENPPENSVRKKGAVGYIPPQWQPEVTPIEFLPVPMDNETLEQFDEEYDLASDDSSDHVNSSESMSQIEPFTFIKVESIDAEEHELIPKVVEEEEEDLKGLCRVCGGSSGDMIDIFSTAGQTTELHKKICIFLDFNVLKTEEDMPKQVCHFCVSGLDACQRLADTAQATQRKLRDVLNARMLEKSQHKSSQESRVDCVEEMDLTSSPIPSTSSHSENHENEKQKSQNINKTKKQNTNEIFTCEICSKKFTDIINLKCHHISIHELYYCIYCCNNFTTNDELKNHEETHFINCKYCNIKIRNGRYFRTHIKEVHEEEYPTHLNLKHDSYNLKCKLCNIIISNRVGAITHYFWEHQIDICEICFQLFDNKRDLNIHLHEVHLRNCKYCPEIFYTYLDYHKHIKNEHNAIEREYQKNNTDNELYCKMCDKYLESKLSIQRHNYWTHNNIFTCYICLETFKTKIIEERHYLLHGNICICCNIQVKTNDMLIEHYNNEHKNLKPFSCENCGDLFKNREELIIHRLTHDNQQEQNVTVNNLKKKLCCPFCDEKFMMYKDLKLHVSNHTDENLKYKCNICNVKFENSNTLNLHIKTHDLYLNNSHNNSIMYKCNICNKFYKNRKDIKVHLTSDHSIIDINNGYSLIQGYCCDFCNDIFSMKKTIKSHILKKHLTV